MKRLVLIATLLLAGLAQAEVRPYVAGSLQQIEREHRGKPFILSFWSATCTHCPAELKALGELVGRYPRLALVIVATDTPAEAPELQRLAQSYGLAGQTQWVFADAQPERLRYEIDRRWYGELPRTYFYDRQHRRDGRSGVVPVEQLERWASEHVK
jgi:thiol-disulfide isomerase/thioredoxin